MVVRSHHARLRDFLFTIDADWVPGSGKGLELLLSICEEMRLKTTIFATGKFSLAYPELVRNAHQQGHEIGVHGWQHPMPAFKVENYRFAPVAQRRTWLSQATDTISTITNQAPRSFRAPYLWIDAATFRLLEGLGYSIDSSVPTRRFDGLVGMINHLEYFGASLDPYHPDRDHLRRKGDSPILEVPPSAFLLPLNMSTLRFFGLAGTVRLARLISKYSSVLNFYCHPWEFVPASDMEFAPGTPSRHRRAVGPHWAHSLRAFIAAVLALGYTSCTVTEVASCGSW